MSNLKPVETAAPTVPYARVDCSGNELAYVAEVLESGWLTTASKARALEQAFIDMILDPDYQAIARHRTAALADARLQPMAG